MEVWYPGADVPEPDRPSPKPLWHELYTGNMDRVSFFMGYLKGVDTHSYQDLPIAENDGLFPMILYNHGLQMFTSQNTLLMEYLASHGYVEISTAHPYESLRVNLPNTQTIIPKFISRMKNSIIR